MRYHTGQNQYSHWKMSDAIAAANTDIVRESKNIVCRSTAAGLQHLQIYEKSGRLKGCTPRLSSQLNFQTHLYSVQVQKIFKICTILRNICCVMSRLNI